MPGIPVLGTMNHAHPYVPRKVLQAEEGAVGREPRDGRRALSPAGMKIVKPHVRDVPRESLRRMAKLSCVETEGAARFETLIEQHPVE